MPQGVGPAIASAWGWLQGAGLGAFAARTALQVAFAYGASQYAARQVKDDPRQSREVLIRSAAQPKTYVLGRAWVAGLLAYSNARPVPGSHDNYELYAHIVHAAHKCADIEELIFDDWHIPASDIHWGSITSSPLDRGYVSGGHYGVLLDGPSNLWAVHLEKLLDGELSPSLYAASFNGDIDTSHVMPGNCCGLYRFIAGKNSEELFASGPPSLIRALVKGALIYDPRKDSTNGGTGSHRVATESTWEWSDNPILCGIWYLLKIMGVASTRIDWPTAITQANTCDALVTIPPSSSPLTKEKRYTCNGTVTSGASDADNLSAILSSCLGTITFQGGKWKLRAGAYVTPDVAITTADIIPNIGVTTAPSRSERYNTVTGTYFSREDTAQRIDFMPVSDSGYVTRDGGREKRKTLDLPMTNSEYMCQRIARKFLNQSDQMITVTLPMRWTGLLLEVGTYVTLTYPDFSWTDKVFRVVGFTLGASERAPVDVVLHEDSSTAWADPQLSDYNVRTATGFITPAAMQVPAVTDAAVSSGPGYNIVTWTNPMNGSFQTIQVYGSYTDQWDDAVLLWEGNGNSFTDYANGQRWYWIIANQNGLLSDRNPDSDTSTLTAVTGLSPLLPNLLPLGYSDFENITAEQLLFSFVEVGNAGSGISTDQAWLGTHSIKMAQTSTALNSGVNVTLSGGDVDGGYRSIPTRPARRYLFIVSVYPDNARYQAGKLRIYMLASENVWRDRQLDPTCPVGEWTRMAFEIDCTATTWKSAVVRLSWISDGVTNSTDPIGYVDGAALIDVTDRPDLTEDNFPTDFLPANGSTMGALGVDGGAKILSGVGSPEGAVTANVGSIYLRTDGGSSTTLYVKQSGTGNTGWGAK